MIYFDEPFLKLHWDDEIEAVWAEWLAFAESSDFRRGLDAGITLVQAKGAARWLADTRNLGPVMPADQQWAETDWLPRALKAGIRYMAFVVPRKAVAQMAVQRFVSKIGPKALRITHVGSPEQARVWLRNQT